MKRKILIAIVSLILIMVTDVKINGAKLHVIKPEKKSINLNKGMRAKINLKGKIIWKTKNRKIATVSSKGIIKAKKPGKTKIIAQKKNKKKIYNIKVVNIKTRDKNEHEKNIHTVSPITEKPFVNTQKPTEAPHVPEPTKTPSVPHEIEESKTAPPQITEEPQPTSPVAVDVWLLFGVDQKEFTSQTTVVTGSVSFVDYESTIRITVNNKVISEQKLNKGEDTFSITVDFSKYVTGDKIVISREYTGNDRPDSSVAIWNQEKSFIISSALPVIHAVWVS